MQLQPVNLPEEWQWIKPRAHPCRRCYAVKQDSSHHNPVQPQFATYQWKHMVGSRNDHTAQVKHPTSLTLTAEAPKKCHSIIKVENVSIQMEDAFIFSCLLITQNQNAVTVSPICIMTFCSRRHQSAFANTLILSFAYSLKKRPH